MNDQPNEPLNLIELLTILFIMSLVMQCCARAGDCPSISNGDTTVCISPANHTDVEFRGYISDFNETFKGLKLRDVHIVWSDTPSKVGSIGLCINPMSKPSWIEIDNTLIYYPPRFIKATVFHEMGHCRLGLEHVDNPRDLMNPYMGDNFDSEDLEISYIRMYREAHTKQLMDEIIYKLSIGGQK